MQKLSITKTFPTQVVHRSGFTLIELLIVIAVIAIIAFVVVLALNPAQLLEQSRDGNRVSDMDTLVHALGVYEAEQIGGSLGSVGTTYVSIPDPSATSSAGDQCQGLGLNPLPTGVYHCAASSTYRNVDGNGWIPINFKSVTGGSPLGSLPIDPLNQSSTGLFYTYETNGSSYEVTSVMESQKYQSLESTDGGMYNDLYERGASLALAAMDYSGDGGNIAFVQGNQYAGSPNASGGNVMTLAFSSNTNAGDLIVAAAAVYLGQTPTCADTAGNTYTVLATQGTVSTGNTGDTICYAKNIAGGADTVEVGNLASNWTQLRIQEYSGIATGNPLDAFTGATGSSTALNSGSANTTSANELIFGAGFSVTNPAGATAGSGFTGRESNYDTLTEDKIVTTAGSYSALETASSGAWVMQMAAFK